jgi:hypothetical protein
MLGFNRNNWSTWKEIQPEDEEEDEVSAGMQRQRAPAPGTCAVGVP